MWAGKPEYTNVTNEKVLLYIIEPVTLSYIRAEIAAYTKYNGMYPEYIDMPEDIWNKFQSLSSAGEIKTHMGIPVRKVAQW